MKNIIDKKNYHKMKADTYLKIKVWLNHYAITYVLDRLDEKIAGHRELSLDLDKKVKVTQEDIDECFEPPKGTTT